METEGINKVNKSRKSKLSLYIASFLVASGLTLVGSKYLDKDPSTYDNQYSAGYIDNDMNMEVHEGSVFDSTELLDIIENIGNNDIDREFLNLYILLGATIGSTLFINIVEDYINNRGYMRPTKKDLDRVEYNIKSLTKRHKSNC